MPNCFSLKRKSNKEAGPVPLQQVDKEIREHLNRQCDEKEWCHGWYNYIGFLIAIGRDWDWIRDDCNKYIAEGLEKSDADYVAYWERMKEILGWLESEFAHDAWAEVGK